MEELFNQVRLEVYLDQIKRNIQSDINNYTETHIATLDIEAVVEQLFTKHSLRFPIIKEEDIETNIRTKLFYGHELPSGTPFNLGAQYPVDIATFLIPFSGNRELFRCIPTRLVGGIEAATISEGRILIELTDWGKLVGNDKALKKIQDEFAKRFKNIQDNLASLKTETDTFFESLKPIIGKYLTDRVTYVKLKIESSGKLNPFNKKNKE
jgi:hypothetical protein